MAANARSVVTCKPYVSVENEKLLALATLNMDWWLLDWNLKGMYVPIELLIRLLVIDDSSERRPSSAGGRFRMGGRAERGCNKDHGKS